jgi:hypothetical protein
MRADELLQLANKYAQLAEADSPGMKLSDLSHDLNIKLRTILDEIRNDIGTLRAKKFNASLLREMFNVKQHLEQISKNFDPARPYPTAQQIVAYTHDRNTRFILENLDFFSEHQMDKNREPLPENFPQEYALQHPQIRCFKLLLSFGDYLQQYMAQNPEIFGLKGLMSEPPENLAETNPGAPQAMRQPA